MSMGQAARRYVYTDGHGSLLIASPDVLSVNQVPEGASEYEGWESLKRRFAEGLRAYREVFPGSLGVERVTVRYINIITIPTDDAIELLDYFTIEVPEVDHFEHLRNFLIRTESRLQGPETFLTLTYASMPEMPSPSLTEHSAFALDLEVYRDVAVPAMSPQEIEDVLDSLHDIENSQFESLITEKTRELFT